MAGDKACGQAASAAEIAQELKSKDDFVLIAHISPDGDTMGSTLALLSALERMGKSAYATVDGNPPHALADLPGFSQLVRYKEQLPQARHAIALDCADRARMGNCAALFDGAERRYVIDHHVSNVGFGDLNLIEDRAATGEIVLDILDHWGTALDQDCARALYVALASDTGGFAYSNTTGSTLRAAARMVETGIDFPALCDRMFRLRSAAKSRMVGHVLSSFELALDGQMASAVLDWDTLVDIQAANTDSDGVIENLRDIEGVEVAVYIRQFSSGRYKVSLRSVKKVDVAALAMAQGGGGHVRAAGFDWHGEPAEILAWLESELHHALLHA